ncbi:Trehalose import ATP-binding protein SugC [Corynebacterium glaucum]|uniref:Trehalose import ATP-binding protein SugC n=2 Tax=Corynebacterium glaucum TaxID=187491 RepID=A0A1Q2HU99_9CORY|nr:Trehalose import ATP-binding protein SugC [Corynebacterium glaucum]
MLAGLEPVDGGAILIDGEDVTEVDPQNRDIAMVFQNYALYPHMTVAQNMSFALKIAKVPKLERMEMVRDAARLLDLEQFLDRKPGQLSGGQRQRVAMGRAIVRSPKVFLMDEPLSNLDAKLRVQTRTQISELTEKLGVTTVYVTHDQVEAMTMGDRVCVLKDGKIQQVGTPIEIYDSPANLFVAGFIGSPAINFVAAEYVDGDLRVDDAVFTRVELTKAPEGSKVVLGIRPEHVHIVDGSQSANSLPLVVDVTELLGSDTFIYGRMNGGQTRSKFAVRTDTRELPALGDTLQVAFDPAKLHVFDASTGLRLNGHIPDETPHSALAAAEILQINQ